ncbi:hypothetical protein BDN72DRAFT_872951 [Pluteus cervinus]|uniref:Uncharacterized protein n=1 Tax=Pluteus cervinus TaxID=181527 RepID=A0ACD3A2T6_9AGAR|nr:hypothetical protein BDN72DRAFT_872951 [Pluteus cervinus]
MPRPPKNGFSVFNTKTHEKTATYTRFDAQGDGAMKTRTGFIQLSTSDKKSPRRTKVETATPSLRGESHGDEKKGVEFRPIPMTVGPNAKPTKVSVVQLMDIFLAEDIRREGRMDSMDTPCPHCENPSPSYRCKDCDGGGLLCRDCIVNTHGRNGLHVIEKWDGVTFQHTTLREAGLRFQLNHKIGETCSRPVVPHNDDFVVVHVNGIHEVGLNFCGCVGAPERVAQVLRYGWFPATSSQPRTAASLAVLRQFHLLSFESKCSVWEFYQALTRLTDNTGVRPARNRYRAFLTMVREYRHLKALKRARRGHHKTGVDGTRLGECAVLCPACPQPGINLPSGWENLPLEKRWIYRLFLGIDANFRLKRRDVSSEAADPSLNKGWAYFVEQKAYSQHLLVHSSDTQQKSTCSSHSAVNNSRLTDGLSASGVGSVGCARHDCMRPHSVGDLQKGERYANMDYLFLSSILPNCPSDIAVSYDIACQWCRNMLQRIQAYGEQLQLDQGKLESFEFLVPKFHLPAHVGSCQSQYSFNFTRYVGRTDGEAPERGWSHINPIALSTAEMGPGSRRDTLDDHFGDWNWKKSSQMGTILLKRITLAVKESAEQVFRYHQFELGLRKKMPEQVDRWEREVIAWEHDSSCTNPFESRVKRMTQEAVRRELAEEDRRDQQKGVAYNLHSTYSGSELIAVGLELEEQQRRVSIDSKSLGNKATDDLKAKVISRGNSLQRRILQWISVQDVYCPGTILLRQDEATTANLIKEPWQIPLFLPSSLPSSTPCDSRLRNIEWRLRTAQAHTALDELRRSLRLRSFLYIDKDRFSRGQRQNTRSITLIERAQVKVDAAAAKYRTAREAITKLGARLKKVGWEKEYPCLMKDDVQPLRVEMNRDVEKKKKKKKDKEVASEGRRKVSWIWGTLVQPLKGYILDLRVEWCKSRARAKRWQEEVLLLKEEMRRVLAFLDFQASEWEDPAQKEGSRAYALQQAGIRRELKSYFQEMWKDVDKYIQMQDKISICR